MNPLTQIVVALLGVAVAAAGAPAKPAKPGPPAPAKSPAPLSKYERAHLDTMKISAPADEYFGKLKISFLGINNTLRDAAITAGDHTTDASVINKVGFAVDALKDWEKKYPRDPQLARSYFLAIGVEKKIFVQANQQEAWLYMNRIADVFPTTYFGKLVKRDLAIGFTEHYYAEPVPCQTPTPAPTASPRPSPTPVVTVNPAPRGRRPSATPSPVPTPAPTPTPSPTPEPTPSPSPEPTQLAKGLKVQLLTPLCVAAPSPTPSPTAVPTATPAAAATATPAAVPLAVPSASAVRSSSPLATASPKPA